MKLRLRNNSLRLRLSQAEVRTLAAGETVSASTPFGPADSLTYRVTSAGKSVSATISSNVIVVSLPSAQVATWATSDELTIDAEQTWDGGSLQIVVEKDLACVSRNSEDDADSFPNPAAASGRCH